MLDKQKIRLPILSLKLYFISLVYLIFTYNCNPNQNTSRLTDVIKIILLSNAISTCEDDPLLCTLSEFQSAPATELNEWLGLQYANGQFVAVASDGTNQVMRSTDGKSWSPHSASANAQWRSITYGNGIWVVVSNNGQRLMTSHDGIVWTNRIMTQENYTSVKFANGKFIAVSTGTTWAISIDGITWTNINSPSVEDWNDLIYGNGIWVAVSIGSRKLATSSDNGITWTTHHSPGLVDDLTSITFGKGVFVAVARSGIRQILVSWNGVDWFSYAGHDDGYWEEVHYANGLFIASASGGSGSRIMSSTDGLFWTSRIPTAPNPYKAIGFGNDTWVILATNGTLESRVQWATWKKN